MDSSFFTFNVLLSNPADFEGGEIYIFSPQQTQKHFARHETMSTGQKDAWVHGLDEQLPKVAGYQATAAATPWPSRGTVTSIGRYPLPESLR